MAVKRKKFIKISPFTVVLLIIALVVTVFSYRNAGDEETDLLYIIPLEGNISGGTADFIIRALTEAQQRQADGDHFSAKNLWRLCRFDDGDWGCDQQVEDSGGCLC